MQCVAAPPLNSTQQFKPLLTHMYDLRTCSLTLYLWHTATIRATCSAALLRAIALQFVAVCYSQLQYVAVCCIAPLAQLLYSVLLPSVLLWMIAVSCSELQWVTVSCIALRWFAVCCSVLQCVAVCSSVLQLEFSRLISFKFDVSCSSSLINCVSLSYRSMD